MLPYGPITEFAIGSFKIQSWGLMVALGFLVGIWLIMYQAKKEGYKREKLLDLILVIFISAIIGSRVFYVFLFWSEFSGNWLDAFKVWQGGMVFYGGFIFAILGWIVYAKVKKLNFWKLADWGAPALALGLAIGRIGCHLIRDHIGIPTTLPWGVEFEGVIRHETAMYSVLANLIIFLLLWFWLRKLKLPTGYLFAIYLIWYSVTRIIIDFLRAYDLSHADPRFFASGDFGGMTISQIISLGIVAICLFFLYRLKKHPVSEDVGLPKLKS
ncbi:prolipoprotein diacylglyceryl transferase [Patescibacteria group bacterium]